MNNGEGATVLLFIVNKLVKDNCRQSEDSYSCLDQ
jgi:hypothetical protein